MLDTFGRRLRVGEVLLRHGTITRAQLDHALASQRKTRGPLGQILITLGYVDDPGMRQALAIQLDIPYLDLDRMTVDRSLSKFINSNYAQRASAAQHAAHRHRIRDDRPPARLERRPEHAGLLADRRQRAAQHHVDGRERVAPAA